LDIIDAPWHQHRGMAKAACRKHQQPARGSWRAGAGVKIEVCGARNIALGVAMAKRHQNGGGACKRHQHRHKMA